MTDDDNGKLLRPGASSKTGDMTVLTPGKVTGRDIVKIWLQQLQEAADAEDSRARESGEPK